MSFIKKNKIPLIITFLFLSLITMFNRVDPDVYWHIKTGEWILQNGIPTTDTFSYWGGNFIAHEWLFDIIIYLIYSLGGYIGVKLISFILIGTSLYLGINISENKNKNNVFVYLLPLLMWIVYIGQLEPRPQLFSLLIMTITIYLLDRNKHLYLIPIFTLFLSNVHGGLVAIIALTIAVYLISYIFDNIGKLNVKNIVTHISIIGAVLASMMINPYGLESITYGSKMPDYVLNNVQEFQPLIQGSNNIFILFIVLIPLACMAYSKKAKLIDVLMVSMATMMSMIYCRMILFWVPIIIIYSSTYIDFTLKDILHKLVRIPSIKLSTSVISEIFVFVFITIFAMNLGSISLENSENNNIFAPKIITNYIEENNIDVENNIMFNDYNFGGYLIFNDYKVFIDGRADVYLDAFGSPEVFSDYLDLQLTKRNTEELIEKYNIKYFALYKDYRLTNYLLENNLAKELVSDDTYILLELLEGGD